MVALIGWHAQGATATPAFIFHMRLMKEFLENETQHHQHAWKMLGGKAERKMRAELGFVIDDITFEQEVSASTALSLLNETVERASKRGLEKLQEQKAEQLARGLRGGAGVAHKMANVDTALPPLRLILEIEDESGEKKFEADPLKVAEHHAQPWKDQRKANSPDFAIKLGNNFQRLRREYLPDAIETAKLMDTDPTRIRKALKLFPSSTAIGADDVHFRLTAELPDVALEQLGLLF